MNITSNPTLHTGSCGCGTVRFEVVIDASAGSRCNCTICTKLGVTGKVVKPDAFTLLTGESNLVSYPSAVGHRYFCRTCGVQCYGRGHLAELGGDFVSVYLNTLDDLELADVQLTYWDGRHDNWSAGPRSTPWPMLTREGIS